jgi:uncharacterized SAM-binding protein YcdF (DUF218 family)
VCHTVGMSQSIAESLNVLVDFCAMRDVGSLAPTALAGLAGLPEGRADVAVLFGGSVVAGAEEFARGMRHGVARRYVVSGGEGHTTEAVRRSLRPFLGEEVHRHRSEASLYAAYLERRHGLRVDALEERSTNCGGNVRLTLELLRADSTPHASILLVQDATMQRRMDAGFRLHSPGTRLVNFAAHRAHLAVGPSGEPSYLDPPLGAWEVDHYVALLLGEIPRLRDDASGYGPRGRGFIAPVEVPPEVLAAHRRLTETGRWSSRPADARWAG